MDKDCVQNLIKAHADLVADLPNFLKRMGKEKETRTLIGNVKRTLEDSSRLIAKLEMSGKNEDRETIVILEGSKKRPGLRKEIARILCSEMVSYVKFYITHKSSNDKLQSDLSITKDLSNEDIDELIFLIGESIKAIKSFDLYIKQLEPWERVLVNIRGSRMLRHMILNRNQSLIL